MNARAQPIHLYVASVATLALPALVYATTLEYSHAPEVLTSSSFWVLLVILLIAELRPLPIEHRVGGGVIALGTMFAVALLHLHGILFTALALMSATLLSDWLNRLGILRAVCNAAMYALSVFTGGRAGARARRRLDRRRRAVVARGAGGRSRDLHHAVAAHRRRLRWDHPVLGSVLPGVFMPLAEQTDLIGAITLEVIDQAFAQARPLARRWG